MTGGDGRSPRSPRVATLYHSRRPSRARHPSAASLAGAPSTNAGARNAGGPATMMRRLWSWAQLSGMLLRATLRPDRYTVTVLINEALEDVDR